VWLLSDSFLSLCRILPCSFSQAFFPVLDLTLLCSAATAAALTQAGFLLGLWCPPSLCSRGTCAGRALHPQGERWEATGHKRWSGVAEGRPTILPFLRGTGQRPLRPPQILGRCLRPDAKGRAARLSSLRKDSCDLCLAPRPLCCSPVPLAWVTAAW